MQMNFECSGQCRQYTLKQSIASFLKKFALEVDGLSPNFIEQFGLHYVEERDVRG